MFFLYSDNWFSAKLLQALQQKMWDQAKDAEQTEVEDNKDLDAILKKHGVDPKNKDLVDALKDWK